MLGVGEIVVLDIADAKGPNVIEGHIWAKLDRLFLRHPKNHRVTRIGAFF